VLPLSVKEPDSTGLHVLTTALARGDDEAWAVFHRDFGPSLFRQLIAATRGDHDLASEALQQTYLRIARHVRPCDSDTMFAAWLRTVARSALHDCLRKRRSFWQLLQRRHTDPSDKLSPADDARPTKPSPCSIPPSHNSIRKIAPCSKPNTFPAPMSAHSPTVSPSLPRPPNPASPAPVPNSAASSKPPSAMIPKSDNRERLLAETYHGDWSSGNASRFAARAARSARRRRTLRLTLKTSGVAALLLAATFAITSQREPTRIARTTPPSAALAPAYEIISDTELLTLVQDRPILLIQNASGPAGQGRIVTFAY
jgi:hypothetical protein